MGNLLDSITELEKQKGKSTVRQQLPESTITSWSRLIKGKILRFLILRSSVEGRHRPEIQIVWRKSTTG